MPNCRVRVWKYVLGAVVPAMVLSFSEISSAQDYPSRDITFVVPYGTGGSTDPISRQFASQLSEKLGTSVNVVNKPGASGTLGISEVVTAKPDGHTIGIASNSPLIFQPMIKPDLPYKTPEDYEPLAKMASLPYVLVVREDAPWETLAEFIADAKKNPDKIRASVSGVLATNDLTMQQLNKAADIKVRTVPFTGGGGEALLALLGGRVEAYVGTGASTLGQEQAGKVRVLAVFQDGQYELFPEATPVGDAGYDATIGPTYYAIAPKGLPQEVLDKLRSASAEIVKSDEYKEFAASKGFSVEALSPEELKEELSRDHKMFLELKEFLGQGQR
jgi:tripartite-type tricarboxylate transporter receptor subunit TctC